MSRSASQTKIISASLLLAGVASILVVYKYATKPRTRSKSLPKDDTNDSDAPKSPTKDSVRKGSTDTPLHSNKSSDSGATSPGAGRRRAGARQGAGTACCGRPGGHENGAGIAPGAARHLPVNVSPSSADAASRHRCADRRDTH
jgi:hypothetical protein